MLNGAHQQHPLVADYPQDPADAGTNLAESDRAEAILAAAKARRVLVVEALRRLDEGSYGLCVDCGRPVPDGRLEAKPEAARCVTCQAKRDRTATLSPGGAAWNEASARCVATRVPIAGNCRCDSAPPA